MAVDVPAFTPVEQVFAVAPFGVDGHHNALGAVFMGSVFNHLRVGNGRRIEAGFVGTRIEQTAHIFDRPDSATHRQRNKHLAGYRLDDVQNQIPPIAGRGDVEKGELICTLLVVAGGNLHRVSGIAQFNKIDALDHAATSDVQTGNDAFG